MPTLQVAIEQDNNHWAVGATNVKFKKSAPGGDVSASFRLTHGHLIAVLRSEAEVYISDRASGKIMWYGRVSNPGSRSENGQEYLDVTCDGSLVTLDQEKKIRPYVVTRYSAWGLSDRESSYPPEATLEVGPMSSKTNDGKPTNTVYEGMTLMVPKGAPVKPWLGANASFYKRAAVKARSYCFDGTGYWIGCVALWYRNYGDSNNWITSARLDNSLGTPIFTDTFAQNEAVLATWYRGRDTSAQQTPTSVYLALELTTAHNGTDGRYAPFWHDGSSAGNARINGDVNLLGDYLGAPMAMYASFDRVRLVAHIWDRFGQPVEAMPNRYWLESHEVVEDILGRDLLNRFTSDDSYSDISDKSTVPLRTLDYTERPVSTRQVLDDLVEANGGDYYYMTLPPRSAGDLPGLTWKQWPFLTPRYSTLPESDFDLTGSQEDLVNRVSVRWKDPFGRVITKSYTVHPDAYPDTLDLGDFNPSLWQTNSGDPAGISSVTSLYNPTLGWSRIVEAEPIDLSEDRASVDIASSLARKVLHSQAKRERSGTVKVHRVMDLWESGIKRACQIEPGYLLQLGDRGDTIRITDVEYDDDSGTASLSVANPGLDVGQIIAKREAYRV